MTTSIVPFNQYEAQNAYRRLQMTMALDDPKTAIIEIRTFLKIYPDVAMACNDLGVLYLQDGEKLLALACYEKANRLQPCTPDIVKNLAEFYFVELKWIDDAIMMLTDILRSFPDDCELLTLLGVISERVGREGEARSFYSRVAELDPYNMRARDALARLGVTVPSAPAYSQPLQQQIQPAYTPPPVAPAPTPPASGGLDDVLARLRATLNSTPQASTTSTPFQPTRSSDDLYREAQGFASAGNNQQALTALEALVAKDPSHALAQNDLGVLYSQNGDFERAGFHYEAAIFRNPSNPVFRKNLAELYYAVLGRTDEAIEIYTRLLREYPSDIDTLTALAVISKANNMRDQARTFIDKVLSLEPWNRDAREFLVGL
jgi:Flp pilus assembly protein TadD